MVWDSDASDVDEELLTEKELTSLRKNFETNLHQVLTSLQESAKYVAVGGPMLLVGNCTSFGTYRVDCSNPLHRAKE